MEGIIPTVYKAIIRFKSTRSSMARPWHSESPSSSVSYVRLPHSDSGRMLLQHDRVFASSSTSMNASKTRSSSMNASKTRSSHPLVACFHS
ncbi:hypothetical protein FRX31_008809 [Thalictrum thalictroides]|uniref:Uncharacterized protein n=1 Tax=Thalictrum thalictroides TaxID=46969 RepID=A0A7J6WYG1_THATH|nr:hypothetical protein FRX31_008809 [Thalictrum thalictroides]